MKNGYSQVLRPKYKVGGEPLKYNQLSDAELDELTKLNPTLTYGNAVKPAPVEFVPAHVAFDKKASLVWKNELQLIYWAPFYALCPVALFSLLLRKYNVFRKS